MPDSVDFIVYAMTPLSPLTDARPVAMEATSSSDVVDYVTSGDDNSSSTYGDSSPFFEYDESVANENFRFVYYHVAVPLVFGLISCSGVLGNTLVIYVILCKERMRTVTNIMLLNLAFADLSFVLVIPP